MKALVWLLVLFAAAVAVALVAHHPGYVLLVYPPYRIEMSLPLFALAAMLAFVCGYVLVRLTLAALRLPQQVRSYRAERAGSKGRTAMLEALTAFFEGRYAAAEQAAVRAMELGEKSGLNSIIAARAANELHEFDKRDAYLAAAQGKTVGDETMRLMAKAEFQLGQQQPHSALSVLKELSDSGIRKHIGALGLELKAQQQARNWDAVLDVTRQLEKRNAITNVMASQMRQQAWQEKLCLAASDATLLQGVWKSMPAEFRHNGRVAMTAARACRQLGDCAMARAIISDSLNAQWDTELAAMYADCLEGSASTQIEQAERWLNQHPEDAGLLLALGKLCLHQELWGKAQNYLDASISLRPSRAAYTALAQLAEKLHKPDAAAGYYQQASELSVS